MASFIPIDVDLNKLFEAKLTYGFDPLKEAIAVRLSTYSRLAVAMLHVQLQ